MKTLFIVMMMSLSLPAFARESVSFTHFGNNGGNQSYYACDYAQDQTESFLDLVGATNVDVTCSGGIQPWGTAFPVSIRADFDLPMITTSNVESVQVDGDTWNPACGLNVQIINSLVVKFPNVKVVRKSDACAFSTSNYSYLLNITR